jgi:phosphonate transport system permease protein
MTPLTPRRPSRGRFAFALIPDVPPSMLSIGLFSWEFNVRASTVLGVVSAGAASGRS